MVSTGITDEDSPHAESIVSAVHYFGIKNIKLGYWRYEPFGSLTKQLDEARLRLERIVRLSQRHSVRPCLHIHSGPILSNGPLLYYILKDFSPEDVGAYVDPLHMTVEGNLSGWEMALDLLAPWVALVGVKNFTNEPMGRDKFGQQRFAFKYVALSDGMAPLPEFFRRLKQIGYDGIVSLHSEYKGEKSFRRMSTPELLEQSGADLRYLKSVLNLI